MDGNDWGMLQRCQAPPSAAADLLMASSVHTGVRWSPRRTGRHDRSFSATGMGSTQLSEWEGRRCNQL